MKEYAEYKDSGVEWLDEVPAHWIVSKMKFELEQIVSGGTPSTSNEQYWANGKDGIPWVAISDMTAQPVVYETAKQVTEAGLDAGRLQIIPKGTLLISIFASLGKTSVLGVDATVNQAILGLTPSGTLDRDFLRYYLTVLEKYIDYYSSSNTQENLNLTKVRNLDLSLPPLDEQRTIATYLDRKTQQIDTLIAKKQRLIDLLTEQRTAVINRAVTQGLDPDVLMQDSGIEWLGAVPAHWEVTKLKFVSRVQSGVAKGRRLADKQTTIVPYLRVANVQDGYLDLSDIAGIEVKVDELDRYRLQPGDVLMTEGGDFDKLGRGAVWNGEIDSCIHQNHVFAVRPTKEARSQWLNLVTQTQYAKHYFIVCSVQSTNLASISQTNLKDLPVLLPPVGEQDQIIKSINNMINELDQVIERERALIAELKELRASLISEVVTGKKRPNGFQKPVGSKSAKSAKLAKPVGSDQPAGSAVVGPGSNE